MLNTIQALQIKKAEWKQNERAQASLKPSFKGVISGDSLVNVQRDHFNHLLVNPSLPSFSVKTVSFKGTNESSNKTIQFINDTFDISLMSKRTKIASATEDINKAMKKGFVDKKYDQAITEI